MAGDPPATLRIASGPEDIQRARALIVEYANGLGVDLCFQGLPRELDTLPGAYAPPRGRLLLAGAPGQAFGCIALRPLSVEGGSAVPDPSREAASDVGEVKRLYVQPAHRGGGWGRKLAEALLADARTIGYRTLMLDTLDRMAGARRLYTELGFIECAPYYDNPLPGVVYMVREL